METRHGLLSWRKGVSVNMLASVVDDGPSMTKAAYRLGYHA